MLPQLKIIISADGVMMNSVKDIERIRAVDLCHSQDMKAAINY